MTSFQVVRTQRGHHLPSPISKLGASDWTKKSDRIVQWNGAVVTGCSDRLSLINRRVRINSALCLFELGAPRALTSMSRYAYRETPNPTIYLSDAALVHRMVHDIRLVVRRKSLPIYLIVRFHSSASACG